MTTGSIEEVKQKTDIVAIIGERIELKKAGRNFKANCPFHGEKTPSFMINPELQIYKCFGCGEGGDVFTFLERYEGMEFSEALKYLADLAGVKLARVNFGVKSEKERIFEINELAAKFYHYVLTSHKAGLSALDYFKTKRGFSEKTVNAFNLGFSPNMPFAAKKFLVDKHKIKIEELVKAGLVYQRGRELFDRFRGRVIFPLQDHRGNIVGFAGRILPADEHKDLAKYINTPETPAYHKGSLLFGLNLTRSEIKRAGEVVIVEGEIDLISSWTAGVKNIVALKGTAMTQEQTSLLSRLTNRIVLALDADIAGDAAARRGITIATNLGLDIRIARLTKYKDPDEAARAEPEYLKKAIREAEGVWDFIIESIFAKHDTATGSGASQISREVIPVIAEIEDKIVQAHFAKVVADKLDVPTESVVGQIVDFSKKHEKPKTEIVTKKEELKRSPRRQLLEERLLTLCFQAGAKISEDVLEFVETSLFKKLLDKFLVFVRDNGKFQAKDFLDTLPAELATGFNKIMMIDLGELADRDSLMEADLKTVLSELKILSLREKLALLIQKMKTLEKMEKSEDSNELKEAFKKYSELLRELDQNP